MTDLASIESNAETWRKRCKVLIDFTSALSWFDDRESFYKDLALNLRHMACADNVSIRLLSPMRDTLVLYAFNGDVDDELSYKYGKLPVETGRIPQLIETGEPIIFDFTNPTDEDVKWERGNSDGFEKAVIVALQGTREPLGTVEFLFHEAIEFNDEDVQWFRDLGRFFGAIIGNGLLSDEMFNLRVLEERSSLSDEIHDSIAQSVSVIALEVNSAFDSLEAHDEEMLRRNLDLIQRASKEVEKAVRGQLSNLREGADSNGGFTVAQLEEMIQAFCAEWGLDCDIKGDRGIRDMVIPGRSASQLTRVVNEALVNVTRHSGADALAVLYGEVDGGLEFAIEDNGCGFDPKAVPPSRLGLRIMHERLDSIGASMNIESSVGNGTRLQIDVPFLI